MISNKINFMMISILLSLFFMVDCRAAAKAPPPPVQPRCPTLEDLFKLPNPEGELQRLKVQKPHCIPRLCKQITASDFFQRAQDARVPTLMSRKMGFFCANVDPEWARLQEVHQGERAAAGGTAFPRLRPVPSQTFSLTPREAERVTQMRAQTAALEDEDRPPLSLSRKVEVRSSTSRTPLEYATLEMMPPSRNFEAERQELERQRHRAEEKAAQQGRLQELQGQFAAMNNRLRKAQENYDDLGVAVMLLKEDLSTLERSRVTVLYGFSASASQHKDPQTYMTELDRALQDPQNTIQLTRSDLAQIKAATTLLREAEKNLREATTDLAKINQELLRSATA